MHNIYTQRWCVYRAILWIQKRNTIEIRFYLTNIIWHFCQQHWKLDEQQLKYTNSSCRIHCNQMIMSHLSCVNLDWKNMFFGCLPATTSYEMRFPHMYIIIQNENQVTHETSSLLSLKIDWNDSVEPINWNKPNQNVWMVNQSSFTELLP